MKGGAQISNSWTKLSAPSNSSGPLVAHVYDNDNDVLSIFQLVAVLNQAFSLNYPNLNGCNN